MKPPDFPVKGWLVFFSDGKMEARQVVLPKIAQGVTDRAKI